MNEKLNEAALAAFLNSEDGPVGRYIRQRGEDVQLFAEINASGEIVDQVSGRLYAGIRTRMEHHNGEICAVIGTDAKSEYKGQEFSYPAYLDQVGSKHGAPLPWLTSALAEEFQS